VTKRKKKKSVRERGEPLRSIGRAAIALEGSRKETPLSRCGDVRGGSRVVARKRSQLEGRALNWGKPLPFPAQGKKRGCKMEKEKRKISREPGKGAKLSKENSEYL